MIIVQLERSILLERPVRVDDRKVRMKSKLEGREGVIRMFIGDYSVRLSILPLYRHSFKLECNKIVVIDFLLDNLIVSCLMVMTGYSRDHSYGT